MVPKTVKACKLVPAVTVGINDNAIEVAKKLHHFQERRIFVINEKKSPIGIISLVDINDRVVAKGKDLKKTKAKDIMTYPLHLILDVNELLNTAMKKMVLKDNFYVPVTEKGVLKGLLTYSSVIKCMKKE
ncbi:CBS domain protein [uncultured archaeon]|nr:CBS domain protein [uncultured archaeon]